MKRKDKDFLKISNPDRKKQVCCGYEYKSAKRLKQSGHIKLIYNDDSDNTISYGDFFIYLSKKGVKKVKKLNKG